MRVLVVDDSAAVRERIVTLLHDIEGVDNVDVAENASRAMELCRAQPPDFVMLDLDLAGQNGLEILPSLKALLGAPTVIVLTNHAGDAYAHRCRQLGADYFFDKSKQFEAALDIVRADADARRQPI
jgi:two-component system, OmpR family, response regulator